MSEASRTLPNRSSFWLRISNVSRCASLSLRDEVDDRDVALLAVAVAAADALLDALRVPRQVVVDDRLAELEVQALRARFGADQHLRARAELVHQREPDGHFARRARSRRQMTPFFLQPARVRLLARDRDRCRRGRA